MNRTPPELVERTLQLLNRLGLPTAIESEPLSEAAALLGHDKKRAGKRIRFVFAEAVGRVQVEPLLLHDVREQTLALASSWPR
jgi:3-dehydroquinate synthetase